MASERATAAAEELAREDCLAEYGADHKDAACRARAAEIIDLHFADTADALMQRDDWPTRWVVGPEKPSNYSERFAVWELDANRFICSGPTPAAACRAALETIGSK